MIARPALLHHVRAALRRSRVVALLGPRQCGKTTLARHLVPVDSSNYFDLEDPATLARLEQPMTALAPLKGVVVIDEVQRPPSSFRRCVCWRIAGRCRRGSSSSGAPPRHCCDNPLNRSPGGSNAC